MEIKTKTPELDKMLKVQPQSQAIGDFLSWLGDEKNVRLCYPHEHQDDCYDCSPLTGIRTYKVCDFEAGQHIPACLNIQETLAEFFKIDLVKCEEERRAILDDIRKLQEKSDEV